MMSNWKELVEDYKKEYDDESGVSEYIEHLLPVYYHHIKDEYERLGLGSPMTITVQDDHVGMALWEIMNLAIYDEYYELFMNAWTD